MRLMADIISMVQKMRDETFLTCEDMVLSNGEVMYSKEQCLEQVALYDELLDSLKHQVYTAEVDAVVGPVCRRQPPCASIDLRQ